MSPSNNGNGRNGVNGKGPNGKFLPGNKFGKGGNPHAEKAVRFRAMLYECTSEDDFAEIMHTLIEKAKAGERWAVSELFNRLLGKPKETIEIQQDEPHGDPFELLSDPDVRGALDRAITRRSAGGEMAEPGSARN